MAPRAEALGYQPCPQAKLGLSSHWTGIGWILLLVWALSHPRYVVAAPCCCPHYHYRRW
jgi:hypothetical protein